MSNLRQTPAGALAAAVPTVRFKTFEQVQAYPAYRFNIDPKTTDLVGLIGEYDFNTMVPCGLSCCHHPHLHGYVAVTSDGEFTNIGKDCGKKHFPDGWAVHRRALESRIKVQRYHAVIAQCIAQKDVFDARLRELKQRTQGGNWQNTLVGALRAVVPFEVMRQLRDRAEKNVTAVFVQREMTSQEMDDEDARVGRESNVEAQRRSIRYIRVPSGHIAGLRIWARPIRKVLVEELEQKMCELLALDIYALSERRLLELTRWVESSEQLFKEADTLVLDGQQFFTKQNLEMLLQFDVQKELRATLAQTLRTFCSKHRL